MGDGMKKEYTIKRMHWEPDPAALLYLQMLWDWNLRVNGEIVQALQKAGNYGCHGNGGKKDVDRTGDAVLEEPRYQ
jgi:hypothetical protein